MTDQRTEADQRTDTMVLEDDVVDVLMTQHQQIRDLFNEVMTAGPDQRTEPFRNLVRLLAVHETAEEEVVHPLARRAIPEGDRVVDERLAEEHDAKDLLSRLDGMETDDAEFIPLLTRLREAVVAHARHEERYEFNYLRARCSPAELKGAATAVMAAEATAPTRPHPGVESAKANLAAGPIAAVIDRTRDAIRAARDKKD